jgi:chromosome segregation ATPase
MLLDISPSLKGSTGMTPEQRFDRYERILKLTIKAGLRSRQRVRALDEKFEILVDAQIRHEERMRQGEDRIRENEERIREHKEQMRQNDERMRQNDQLIRRNDQLFRRTDERLTRLTALHVRTEKEVRDLIKKLGNVRKRQNLQPVK